MYSTHVTRKLLYDRAHDAGFPSCVGEGVSVVCTRQAGAECGQLAAGGRSWCGAGATQPPARVRD